MTTTGALGRTWRAEVTTWGAVVPWDGAPVLEWAVAADDRWHRPADEPTIRQQLLQGTPVVETRLRVPGGDAVQRVWSVAAGGGLTLVEVHNDSPLPIAVAFTRPDLLTTRPPTDVPIEGIDLPAGSVLLPIGHRTGVVIGLAHDGRQAGPLPGGWAEPEAVARGWRSLAARAGRLALPDERVEAAVVAARCELLLAGLDDADEDPVAFLIGLGEQRRLGELTPGQADAAAVTVAAAVEAIARCDGWDVDAALDAAGAVLHHAGDRRAVRDVAALIARRGASHWPAVGGDFADRPGGIRVIPFVERSLAARGELLPGGLAAACRGSSIEAHGLPIGSNAAISYALRWHGANLAVLWETAGDRTPLRAPQVAPRWSTAETSGEALWVDPSLIGSRGDLPAPDGSSSSAGGAARLV